MLSKPVEQQMLALLRTHRGVEGVAAWSLIRGWLIAGQECPQPASPKGIRKWMTDKYAQQFMKALKSLPKRIVPRGVMAALSEYKPKRGRRKEKAMSTSETSVIENLESTKKSPAKKAVKTTPVKPSKSKTTPKETPKVKATPAAKAKSGKTAKATKPAKEVTISKADIPKREGTVSIGTETPRKGSKIEKIVAVVAEQRGKQMKYAELIAEGHKRKIMPRPRGVIRQTERAISNRVLAFKASK